MKKLLLLVLQVAVLTALAQPPTITSFTPAAGPVGTAVTINGTGFSPTPTKNIVYFGAVKAPVVTASSTLLTVTTPAGATFQPISVTVNGLTAYANKPFVGTFENKGPDRFVINSFVPTAVLHASDPYGNTIISDLDGDGKSEIVVMNTYNLERQVSIFRNWSTIGTILFTYLPDYTIHPVRNATGTPYGFATGDLNGDGKPDLVVMSSAGQNELTGTASIFINTTLNGDISFAETRFHLQGHVAIADMDLDGKPDLILTNGQTTSVYRNTSAGDNVSFAVGLGFDASAVNLAIRDLDGDGKPDLVANDYDSLIILRNTSSQGQIDFAAKTVYTGIGNSAADVAIGDLDGDGKPDLALIDHYAEQVFIRKNTSTSGSISFANYTSFRAGLQPNKVAIGDLDGDGKPDLAVANTDANTFSILKNTSVPETISFAEKVDYSTETGVRPTSIAIGDLDNDGKADLVESNDDIHNSLIVFRNQIGETPRVPTFLNEPTIVLDASCSGNDGLISIIPTSGKLPILYSIDGGATYVEGPETGYSFQGLEPGLYQLRIKDYFGLESVIVTKEVRRYYGGPLFRNDGTIVLDASCGANDGNISIIPTCGAAPFMYSIDGGMTYVEGPATGYTFQNLAPGTYQLRLKDAYGTECAIVTRQVRQFYGGPTFRNDNSIVKDVSCAANDGTVSIIPITGTGPFQYSINGGETYVEGPSTGYTFMNLQAGTYELRLKDARGCESEVIPRTVNASEFLPAPYGFVTASPTCSWGANGSMIVSLPGKLFPSENTEEEYSIDGGVTYRHSNFFGGLKQGDYLLKARKNNCESPMVPLTLVATIVRSCFPVSPKLISPFEKSAMQAGDGFAAVYPNPSQGKFQVQLKKFGAARVQVQILDSKGSVLQTKTVNAVETNTVDIDLSGKAKGLYLIRIVSDKGTQQTKVLIQ